MSTDITKVKGTYFTFYGDKYHKITPAKFPLCSSLINDNVKEMKDGIKEFYIYREEFQPYIDELVNKDYPYEGINIYESDQKTVAFQIIRMY